MRRDGDDLGQPIPAQWLHQHQIVDRLGQPGPLWGRTEELRAQRGHYPNPTTLTQRAPQQVHERPPLIRPKPRDHLLRLIDHDQQVLLTHTTCMTQVKVG
jgi:hypothetical protein